MKERFLVLIAAILVGVGWAAPSQAAVIVLTFEGIGDGAPIGNYYNGGGGPNFGIEFSDDALGLIDADAGGNGNFGGEPSPSTAMYFVEGNPYLNVAAGFTTGFSFYYTAVLYPGSVTIWDGLDGTGTVLTSLDLPTTPFQGAQDPSGDYSPFVPIGVAFDGTARSVTFGGVASQIAFDDVTLGSETPDVPEPTTVALLGAGLVGLARRARRR